MRRKVQLAIQKFRRANPQTSGWANEEVLEAMFLIASQQDESGIRVVGRHASVDFPYYRCGGRPGRALITHSPIRVMRGR